MYNNGVRAEPRFLRDPTSLESISSGISKLSSYVASNLSKKRNMTPNPTAASLLFEQQQYQRQYQYSYQQQQQQQQHQQQHLQPQQQTFVEDVVVEEISEEEEADIITFASFDKLSERSCLLLGYQDGFQLWDITSPENVYEICSIRDKEALGLVSCVHVLKQTVDETLIALVTERDKTSKLFIYSLKTYSIVAEINDFMEGEDETTLITCIKTNHKIIALGCLSRSKSSIHLLSVIDYKPIASPLFDVYHDIHTGPVFALNSRFIAYATNVAVLNSDPVMTSLTDKLQADKDVKGAAKDIAKEVVSGMKTLGEFGYQRLSNYFGNPPPSSTIPQLSAPLMSPILTSEKENTKKIIPSGMVIIRDVFKLPDLPTKNLSNASSIAHFRPHTHPVSCLNFNRSGTLLLSASKQGHTFHVFSVLTNTLSNGNVSHLYSLSRGFTDAQVEDCQFSIDSNWCAISTARGTSHVYAINPYGGKPEILGHVHSKVNNNHRSPFANKVLQFPPTTLGSVARIKQRRRMPDIKEEETPIPRHQKEPRAKLTTSFVNSSQPPYFVNSDMKKDMTIKQQATHMLKHIPYIPPPSPQVSTSSDLMFGFDEEYEDAAKMINDEIGYRDIYTFHPIGVLTLHRCWVAKMATQDRLDLSLKKESVAEWKVARDPDWDPLMAPVEMKKKKEQPPLFWLSNAEIATYPLDQQPLWSHQQFVFQTFTKCEKGKIPETETMIMLKEMPEPISSRIDRVSKTTTRIANEVEENLDDALQELEDNISNAMQTSFSSTEPISYSPAKWMSTSSPKQFTADKTVSFEDAYLIHMGSGPSPDPLQSSALIQLDDQSLEEDTIKFESDLPLHDNLYSPDGDNEVARPFESVFEGFHAQDDSGNFPWNE
ncbi:hypothetical protein BY458DRAFT_539949 [Sporodiniella umbellata]|nr:hypothetical protein BY458DRAFT_539949 [Sporodiniella umbellata]